LKGVKEWEKEISHQKDAKNIFSSTVVLLRRSNGRSGNLRFRHFLEENDLQTILFEGTKSLLVEEGFLLKKRNKSRCNNNNSIFFNKK